MRRALRTKLIIFSVSMPQNMPRKPEPSTDMNATPASPAIALASKVLPVPGGPNSMMPFMYCPPI